MLGLEDGAGWEVIKSRQRALVKDYHPDRFQSREEIEAAHHKMADINRSVAYLKKLHLAGAIREKTKTTPKPAQADKDKPPKTRDPVSPDQTPKPEPRKTETSDAASYDAWVANRRRRAVSRAELETRFNRHRTRVTARYVALLQQSAFKTFFARKETALGPSNAGSLYERYVEFRKIQNYLFYAINRPVNLILKYVAIFWVVIQMIRAVLGHFYQGRLVFKADIFYGKILWLTAAFLVLTVSDLLFRYSITFRFGHEKHVFYENLMKNGYFMGSMRRAFHSYLILKYALAVWLLLGYSRLLNQ